MKTLVAVILSLALAVTGCDSGGASSMSNSGWDLEDAFTVILIAGTVITVAAGSTVYNALDHRNEYDHKPGLNVRAPEKVKRDKTFEVKVAAANAKAKPQVKWWNAERAPELTITGPEGVPTDTAPVASVVSTEVKKEWHITRFRVAQPGTYTLKVEAPVPGVEPGSDAIAEVTREIAVR